MCLHCMIPFHLEFKVLLKVSLNFRGITTAVLLSLCPTLVSSRKPQSGRMRTIWTREAGDRIQHVLLWLQQGGADSRPGEELYNFLIFLTNDVWPLQGAGV